LCIGWNWQEIFPDLNTIKDKGQVPDYKKELANIQEKLQKLDTNQLATDDFITSFDKDILKQILPHENDSLVLLSVFEKNFYTPDAKLNKNYEKHKAKHSEGLAVIRIAWIV
jgi:hypothetical protein